MTKSNRRLYGVLAAVLGAEFAACASYAQRRHIVSETYRALTEPIAGLHTLGGAYPPGPAISYYLARSAWDIGPIAWNVAIGVFALTGLVVLARVLWPDGTWQRTGQVALTLAALNLYGMWLLLTSDDTALENACFIWGAVALYWRISAPARSNRFWQLAAATAPLAACFMRVSSFVTWTCLLMFMLLTGPGRRVALPLILVITTAIGYAFWNARAYGEFTLTTTTSENLFLGNNEAYFQVHPYHDIEALDPLLHSAEATIRAEHPGADEALVSSELRRVTMKDVAAHPADSAVRAAMKLQWYFLGVTKIPVLTDVGTRPDPLNSGGRVLSSTATNTLASLPYGVVFLVLFWLSLVHFVRAGDVRMSGLFVPFVAMGFLGMVLFPDTRFRQAAEWMTYLPIGRYVMLQIGKVSKA